MRPPSTGGGLRGLLALLSMVFLFLGSGNALAFHDSPSGAAAAMTSSLHVYDAPGQHAWSRDASSNGHAADATRPTRQPGAIDGDRAVVATSRAAAEDGLMAGSGPGRGVLEVSSQVRSTAAVRNFNPGSSREFVFDPSRERFVVGRSEKGFGHYGLAQEIGADENTVVGGMLSRGPDGEFFTNEMSGHYGSNWTDPVRQQFVDFMRGYGFDIEHAMWGAGG